MNEVQKTVMQEIDKKATGHIENSKMTETILYQ